MEGCDMNCCGCSDVKPYGEWFEEVTTSVSQVYSKTISAIRKAPQYWVNVVKTAFCSLENQLKSAPSFLWGKICAAPYYFAERISALALYCLHIVNRIAGIDIDALEQEIQKLKREKEEILASRPSDERTKALEKVLADLTREKAQLLRDLEAANKEKRELRQQNSILMATKSYRTALSGSPPAGQVPFGRLQVPPSAPKSSTF
jgi:hypothetical protein